MLPESWVADSYRTDKSKPPGILPSNIGYPTDEMGGMNAPNWYRSNQGDLNKFPKYQHYEYKLQAMRYLRTGGTMRSLVRSGILNCAWIVSISFPKFRSSSTCTRFLHLTTSLPTGDLVVGQSAPAGSPVPPASRSTRDAAWSRRGDG